MRLLQHRPAKILYTQVVVKEPNYWLNPIDLG
jgi:hypothetical protein